MVSMLPRSRGLGAYSSFFDGWTIRTENELLCGGGEVKETGNGEIFVVQIVVVAEDIIGLVGSAARIQQVAG